MLTFFHDYHTESFGTDIIEVIPPVAGMIPVVTQFEYRVGSTAHNLYFMKCCGITTFDTSAVASQAVVTLLDTQAATGTGGNGEALAAQDWIVYQNEDGAYEAGEVSSVSGNDVTLVSNLGTPVDAGAPVYCMMEIARGVHHALLPAANTQFRPTTFNLKGGISGQKATHVNQIRSGASEPMLFFSDNLTAAGFLECMSGHYEQEVALV